MKFESKGLISLEINGEIYDYKLYQSLDSLSRTKSQRKSAKELNISHTVFNRRLLKAEDKLGVKITEKIGNGAGELTPKDWLALPEQSLAEATNGEIFFDNYGELTKIREKINYYPQDVRLKKLAGNLLLMAQSGQYNYKRCSDHREQAAAQLAVFEFVNHAIAAVFLLNRVYMPYYKWSFKALRGLPKLSAEAETFEYLITTGNSDDLAEEKYYAIEGIAADIIDELAEQGLTKAICGDLEKHAYSVNDGIGDGEIRNMHILAAV